MRHSTSVHGSDPDLQAAIASRTRFKQLVHVESCESTQDLAQRDEGVAPCIFWADHQTAGRGRQGREWSDQPGLDLAVTLRVPALSLGNPVCLAAAVPLAVLQALESRVGRNLKLKWPNDLLLGGRKICGILMDSLGRVPETYLLGVGINVNRTCFPAELTETATSLALTTGRETDRGELLLDLAVRIHDTIERLERDDWASLQTLFAERLGLMNRRVTLKVGSSVYRGRMVALDFERIGLEDGTSVPLGLVQSITAGADQA